MLNHRLFLLRTYVRLLLPHFDTKSFSTRLCLSDQSKSSKSGGDGDLQVHNNAIAQRTRRRCGREASPYVTN